MSLSLTAMALPWFDSICNSVTFVLLQRTSSDSYSRVGFTSGWINEQRNSESELKRWREAITACTRHRL